MTTRIIRKRTKTSCLLLSLLLNSSSNAFMVPSSTGISRRINAGIISSSSSTSTTKLSYSIIEASKGENDDNNNENNNNNNSNNNGAKPKWSPSGGGGGSGSGSGIGFGANNIGGSSAGGTPDFTSASASASSAPAASFSSTGASGGGDDFYAAEMKRREGQTGKVTTSASASTAPSKTAPANGGTPDFTFGGATSTTSSSSAGLARGGIPAPGSSSSSTISPSFSASSAGPAGGGGGGTPSFSSSTAATSPSFSSSSASSSVGPAGGTPAFGSTTPNFSSSSNGPAASGTPAFGASSPNSSSLGAGSTSSSSSSFSPTTSSGPSSSSFGPTSSSSNSNNFQGNSNQMMGGPPPSGDEKENKEDELPQGMVKAELFGAKAVNDAFTQKFNNDFEVGGSDERKRDNNVEMQPNSYATNSNNMNNMNSMNNSHRHQNDYYNNNDNNVRNNDDHYHRSNSADSGKVTSLEEENRLLRELAMRLEREQAELTGRRTESRIPNNNMSSSRQRSPHQRQPAPQIRRASAAANVASNAPPRYNERMDQPPPRHHHPRHTAFANVQNKMVARSDEELRAKQLDAEMNAPFFDNVDKRRQFMDIGNRNKMRSNLAVARANRKLIQGKTLLTWSFMSPSVRQVQVKLTTDGRPIDAEVELWDGPDNIPHKMKIYSESGYEHPFHAILATPGGFDTVAVRNVGDMEFPVKGQVMPVSDERNGPMGVMIDTANAAAEYYLDDDQPSPSSESERPQTIQGGALRSFTYGPEVESIQVLLRTQGRPIQAKIELIQGPNNNKEVIEIYTQNGETYPFYGVFESMGRGSVIRIINTAPMEFPITVLTSPYKINYQNSHDQMSPIIR